MKIFISWSGKLSHQIAQELKNWLPLVINELQPFVSSEDIKKGSRWFSDVGQELYNSNFGIISLTKENLQEPWIYFEAGALSKNIADSKVTCLLFDDLKQTDVKPPLSLFQNTEFNKTDVKKLIISINKSLNKPLEHLIIERAFEMWFPELEKKIADITKAYFPERPVHKSNENALEEILRNTNFISNVVSRFNLKLPTGSLDFVKFASEQAADYGGNLNNHPVKITINPVPDKDKIDKLIVITNNGITIKPSPGAFGRGILIEILFHSEHQVFWTLSFHFHKGDTYVKSKLENLSSGDAKMYTNKTIWRD